MGLFKKAERWRGSPESIEYRPGFGSFLSLLVMTAVGVAIIGFFFWLIPTVGFGNIHPALPYLAGAVILGGAAFILLSAVFISMALIKGRLIFYSEWIRWLLVKLFLPLMVMLGGLMRIPRIRIEQAFIDINNQMVRLMARRWKSFKPGKLLILMPHCIQWDDCKLKVTRNVKNCAGCGRCEIGGLITLADEYGVSLFISTGGTVARRKVYEERPDAVIAVACERDLTSGLQDSYPLPVIAIVNKRPRGYCMETGVELSEVKRAIADLMG